ncbi:DUF302 domain-containing protein [Marivita hallyeonensis]|uniref:Uncharacterized conserved protein, DUF302 family n=1 Tax=Marivita hallyeonensis TaxID=996342 RepID=A0A1M5P7B9_9RHOB|nr:DUF302 domain-containing protein [Marivita hallyeonensis]SHG97704.1 Uncharacterized conserved protein, DUF302 family [Marivita hallyeonensis]
MKHVILAVGLALAATTATAGENGMIQKDSALGVTETVDAMVSAMEEAGITIFARVDHGAGAQSIGEDVGEMQLLVFGNPKVGTPAIKDDPVAGLYLPLKVLVYTDGMGATKIVYEEPAAMLGKLGGVSDDAAYLNVMAGALQRFTDGASQ